jgi:hypothetical protein
VLDDAHEDRCIGCRKVLKVDHLEPLMAGQRHDAYGVAGPCKTRAYPVLKPCTSRAPRSTGKSCWFLGGLIHRRRSQTPPASTPSGLTLTSPNDPPAQTADRRVIW